MTAKGEDGSGSAPATGSRRQTETLAHDLRNAISGVAGHVELAREAGPTPELVVHLDGIVAGLAMLRKLCEALTDEGAGGSMGNGSAETLGSVVREVARSWSGAARLRGHEVSLDLDPQIEAQTASGPLHLRRILGNLVGNAVKHGGTGGIEIRLSAGAPGQASIDVLDSGPGIPAELLELLHAPCESDGRAETGGPAGGMGLRIARDLATECNATLTLGNRAEGGCAARIVVALTGTAAPAPPAAPRPAATDRAGMLAGFHVLLAEDNVTNQLVARQMLERLGATVEIASDGAEALERLDRGAYDLVLVDIEMPRVSGLDVIRRVRAMPDARAGLTLIALTAYAMQEHRRRISEAGADGVIAKPILGIAEFGEEILALHAPRAARMARGAARASVEPAGGPAAAPVERSIYDMLAQTIGAEGMAELLEKVEADLEDVGTGISEGVARGDLARVRAKSHVLISVAGAIGAVELQKLAERINRAAHHADAQTISGLAGEIARGLEELGAFVQREREARHAHG